MKMISSIGLIGLSLGIHASENFVDFQSGCRRGVMERANFQGLKFLSPIQSNDLAEDLIDNPSQIIKNLDQMQSEKLLSGEVEEMPWSDTYWPLYKGGLGQRYADDEMSSLDFKEAFEYLKANPAEKFIADGRWNDLSPAEKYDSLMGLKSYPLTQASWAEGQGYLDELGNVESWMGLCHGWAAVSMMMPEPVKSVDVDTANGFRTFFPSDIKGLGTLLWAKGDFETRFIGGRCDSKNPAREKNCLDNNPGTWHQVVVNQIGMNKRSFVMDANYSYEVWNHPVYSYEYKYFHPVTKKMTNQLSEAIIKRGDFEDPRSRLRARNSKYIVGINMKVTYLVENYPTQSENQEKLTSFVNYLYDLELGEDYEILGGEWHEKQHPDFLWVPVLNTFPVTYADRESVKLDFLNLPNEYTQVAEYNAHYGLPWGPVVRFLFEESSKIR